MLVQLGRKPAAGAELAEMKSIVIGDLSFSSKMFIATSKFTFIPFTRLRSSETIANTGTS